MLKSEKDLTAAEKVQLFLHITYTGFADSLEQIPYKLEVGEGCTLNELKETILSLPTFEDHKDIDVERVRLRERLNNFHFGKVYRDSEKGLKENKIKTGMHLVV